MSTPTIATLALVKMIVGVGAILMVPHVDRDDGGGQRTATGADHAKESTVNCHFYRIPLIASVYRDSKMEARGGIEPTRTDRTHSSIASLRS